MNRSKFLAIAGLLIIPVALGQATLIEDFEDDTVGQDPTGSFYTYTEIETTGNQVTTAQAFSGSKSFAVIDQVPGDAVIPIGAFTLNNAATTVQLRSYYVCTNNGGNNGVAITNGASTIASLEVASLDCRLELVHGDEPTGELMLITTPGWHTYRFEMTGTNLFRAFFDELDLGEFPTLNPATEIIQVIAGVNYNMGDLNNGKAYFDDLTFDGQGSDDPTEFDQGLVNLAVNLGFITPASQQLFSLILIAAASIIAAASTKIASPGKWKNYLILGAGALMGVFLLALNFLDFWEWIVAFMLAIFGIRGAKEARNTLFEIQDKIRGGIGHPTGSMAAEGDSMAFSEMEEAQVDE